MYNVYMLNSGVCIKWKPNILAIITCNSPIIFQIALKPMKGAPVNLLFTWYFRKVGYEACSHGF